MATLESKNKSGMAVVTSEKLVESLRAKMKPLVQSSGLSESQMSLYVGLASNENPQEILNVQGKKKIIPASVTKLVTAGAVIHHFPPGFKFKTTLLSNAKVENGVLKGDLYLKGGGDPSFVSETMWYLVNVFTRQQIQSVEGKIIVDDSLFDRQRFDSSRQKERVDRAYDAPTGAMSFNWNSINIFIRPGQKSGEEAKVFADPESDYIRLKTMLKPPAKEEKHRLRRIVMKTLSAVEIWCKFLVTLPVILRKLLFTKCDSARSVVRSKFKIFFTSARNSGSWRGCRRSCA